MSDNTNLKLTLSSRLWNMIDSGKKSEESKAYWYQRLCRKNGKRLSKSEAEYLAKIVNETNALGFRAAITQGGVSFRNYDTVTFYRGVPYFSNDDF